jgi:hypothetical protein
MSETEPVRVKLSIRMPCQAVLQDEYTICVISGFYLGVNEIFALLGCHAVLTG